MKPKIDKTSFGSITIAAQKYPYDILIGLDGGVEKRKKKLSKELYGTSHKISLPEAKYIFEAGAEKLLIGSGMFDRVHLSEEAKKFFDDMGIEVVIASTPKAIKIWNETEGKTIGLFHVTC